MDQLTTEMQAMLRIDNARKLANTAEKVRNAPKPPVPKSEKSKVPAVAVKSALLQAERHAQLYQKPVPEKKTRHGILRREQIHDLLHGDWDIIGQIHHDVRDIPTVCNFKAKHVFVLKDRTTGRVIHAARGEITAHTTLQVPKFDRNDQRRQVSAAFA